MWWRCCKDIFIYLPSFVHKYLRHAVPLTSPCILNQSSATRPIELIHGRSFGVREAVLTIKVKWWVRFSGFGTKGKAVVGQDRPLGFIETCNKVWIGGLSASTPNYSVLYCRAISSWSHSWSRSEEDTIEIIIRHIIYSLSQKQKKTKGTTNLSLVPLFKGG